MNSLTKTVLMLTLVAMVSALPSNSNAPDEFVEASSRNFEKYMTADPTTITTVRVAQKDAVMPKPVEEEEEHSHNQMFSDDPLSSTVANGRAEDFMNAFKKLDTLGERMPPADELTEEGAKYVPSEPIAEGYGGSAAAQQTDAVVHEEANVPALGQSLAAAEKAGAQEAKAIEVSQKEANKVIKKADETAKKEVKQDAKDVKKEDAAAAKPAAKKATKTAPKQKSASSSMRSLSFVVTMGVAVVVALVV